MSSKVSKLHSPSRQKLVGHIAAAQKQADAAKKSAQTAKALFKQAKKKFKEARRNAKTAKKAVKTLKQELKELAARSAARRKKPAVVKSAGNPPAAPAQAPAEPVALKP